MQKGSKESVFPFKASQFREALGSSMHRISVITPSFKQLAWLKLCAASVADQAGVEVEHLVQDAGTGPELEEWAGRQPQVKLRMEKDSGMYDAINRGLQRATGEICAYLNCDEQYLPGTLLTVAEFFATHPEVDVLFGDAILIDSRGNPVSYRRMVVPGKLHTRLVHLGTLSASTFFRRSVVERNLLFDPQWRAIGDAVWVDRLLTEKIPMAVLPQPLSVFTMTGVNLGAQGPSHQEVGRWRKSCQAPSQWLKPPAIVLHRLKKMLAGAYSPKSCPVRIYTPDSPTRRKHFEFSGVRFRWASGESEAPAANSADAAPEEASRQPKIAAVFSTFNRMESTLGCLRLLAQQRPALSQIVVADNASTDETRERIQLLREELGASLPVTVIPLPENMGNPAGIRVAMRHALDAGADWIWLLDDDSWPKPDTLENLTKRGLEENTVYSPLVLDPKKNDLAWPRLVLRCNERLMAMTLGDLPKEQVYEVQGAWLGALISAQVVAEVGEVNPELFIRGEDEEYPARIRQHGFKILCVADSILTHPSPAGLLRLTMLGRNFFYEPNLPLWKSYYMVRNHFHVRKQFAANRAMGLFRAFFGLALALIACLAVEDQKLARMGVLLKAGWHGLIGKLGKQVPPND